MKNTGSSFISDFLFIIELCTERNSRVDHEPIIKTPPTRIIRGKEPPKPKVLTEPTPRSRQTKHTAWVTERNAVEHLKKCWSSYTGFNSRPNGNQKTPVVPKPKQQSNKTKSAKLIRTTTPTSNFFSGTRKLAGSSRNQTPTTTTAINNKNGRIKGHRQGPQPVSHSHRRPGNHQRHHNR